MEVNGQLHAPSVLVPEKEPPLPIKEAWCSLFDKWVTSAQMCPVNWPFVSASSSP